jgi:hypothetical protein
MAKKYESPIKKYKKIAGDLRGYMTTHELVNSRLKADICDFDPNADEVELEFWGYERERKWIKVDNLAMILAQGEIVDGPELVSLVMENG